MMAAAPKVSVVISTMRPAFLEAVFSNFERQEYPFKELIIIVHKGTDAILELYKARARGASNIRIESMGDDKMLGECYDWGCELAQSDYILTMTDDDYYGPKYMVGIVGGFQKSGADVVGKASFYTYLVEEKLLLLYKKERADRDTSWIAGAAGRLAGGTISFRRKACEQVKFADKSVIMDKRFQVTCGEKHLKFYSIGYQDYVLIRYGSKHGHVWSAGGDRPFPRWGYEVVAKTDDFIPFIVGK